MSTKNKRKTQEDNIEDEEPQIVDGRQHFKLGQKFVTPVQGDSTRGFYESLYEENPNSPMAIRFCVEYGIIPSAKLDAVYKKFLKLKDDGAYSSQKQAVERLMKKQQIVKQE
jgi:hypothetical protein